MKTVNFFRVLAAIAMLTACSDDENEMTGLSDSSSRAVFSASIEGQTRAADTSWDTGDKIGISGTTGEKTYTNVAYTTANGDGSFSAVTSGEEIYYHDEYAVSFTAYYPWAETLEDSPAIAADTREQAKQKDFDFMWTQAVGSKESPEVSLIFSHLMTKVALTVKTGDGVSLDEAEAAVMSLDGFNLTGTFDATTGLIAADEGTSGTITFANSGNALYNAPSVTDQTAGAVCYTMIVFPQELAATLPISVVLNGVQTLNAELDFTAANTNAGDADPKNEWAAGRQYNLSVTLYKTYMTVDGCTIDAWENVDFGSFDAQ